MRPNPATGYLVEHKFQIDCETESRLKQQFAGRCVRVCARLRMCVRVPKEGKWPLVDPSSRRRVCPILTHVQVLEIMGPDGNRNQDCGGEDQHQFTRPTEPH